MRVVTPNLNKSFKFQSEWPNNSSQAYLLESLINDVNNDEDATITTTKDGYTINSKVNYPNNAKLDNELITLDKDFNVKKVEVMNVDGEILLSVEVIDIDYKPTFSDDYFDLTIEEEEKEEESTTTTTTKTAKNDSSTTNTSTTTTTNSSDCLNECETDECKNSCKEETTSNVLEDIIYPLYVPQDTYLASKDKVKTDDGERVILTFSGTDPFILVEEVAKKADEFEIIPVSGEPLMLDSTVGALTSNSIYFTNNGVDYYLTSNSLNSDEMMMVAKSITTSASAVSSMK